MTKDAKLVGGVWLPDTEEHLVGMMLHTPKVHRIVDGKATYQYHKIERALRDIPKDRRRVAVDVGAHVGLWAMHLVRAFDFVNCFEPLPLHARLLMANMEGVPNYELWRHALGDADGSVRLSVDPKTTGNTHIVAGEGDVPMHTLDSCELDDVDFIKIDVEGFELQVVRGAVETIKRCRPYIIIEQKGHEVKYQSQPRDAALAFCRSLGMVDKWVMSGDHFLAWE